MESDAEYSDLIQQLLLEADRIMEDSSPELSLKLADDATEVSERIDRLAKNTRALRTLAAAAQALSKVSPGRR